MLKLLNPAVLATLLRTGLYVARNHEQLRNDLTAVWHALNDGRLDAQDREQLCEIIDHHGEGLGFWG